MDFDVLGLLLHVHSQDFTQKIELFFIAWFIIKRTIKGHFSQIEMGLTNVVTQLANVDETLKKVATGMEDHSKRIQGLENRMSVVETKGEKNELVK